MDATRTILDQLDDPDLFEKVEGIPVFDEHEEPGPDGQPRRFDRSRLQKIADHNNTRATKTGDLAPLMLGHTRDAAPETEQPPIVGWVKDYRVAPFGPEGKLAVVCDHYFRKDKGGAALLREYPRRSIELWPDGTIDPIALLRRTPRRDLGLPTTYRRSGQTITRYSYEDSHVDDLPMAPADGGAPDDFDAKCDQYMAGKFPHLGAMHEKYAADFGGAPAAGPALPGAGNTAIPGAAKKPLGPDPTQPPVPDDEGPERMQRDQLAVKYSRLEAEYQTLKAEVTAQKFARHQADSERLVIQLEAEGYRIPDRAREVGRMAQLDEAGRNDRADEIRTCYQRAPVSFDGFVPLAQDPSRKAPATSRDQRDQAVSLAGRKGISFDEALMQVKGS